MQFDDGDCLDGRMPTGKDPGKTKAFLLPAALEAAETAEEIRRETGIGYRSQETGI